MSGLIWTYRPGKPARYAVWRRHRTYAELVGRYITMSGMLTGIEYLPDRATLPIAPNPKEDEYGEAEEYRCRADDGSPGDGKGEARL